MKYSFFILFLVFNNIKCFSQNYVDLLKISGGTTSFNKFDTSNSKTKINEMNADLTIPIKMSDKLSLLTGAIYESFQTRLFAYGPIKNFGSTTLKLGANNQLNEHWSTTMVLLPKIASDYTSISRNDFQIGAIAIMKYKKNENLSYKFGLYYNSELFGPFFVPMVGLYYLSADKKFETNLMLPLQADANYKLNSLMAIGFNFNGQIRSYHLSQVKPENPSTYVARSTNELFAYLKFNVTKSFSIQTKVGQSIGRSYRVYEENDKVSFGLPATFIGDTRHQLNTNFSNGLIFQVTLLYRFNLNFK